MHKQDLVPYVMTLLPTFKIIDLIIGSEESMIIFGHNSRYQSVWVKELAHVQYR